jgi:hypothetical protein
MRKRSSKKTNDSEQVAPAREEPEAASGGVPSPSDHLSTSSEPAPSMKNPAAVALGRLGGKKGGKARAAKLTAAQRRAIAKKAAEARWKKKQG